MYNVNFKSQEEWENFQKLAKLGQLYLLEKNEKQFSNKTTREIFTTIYEKQMWGKSIDGFHSGPGTHEKEPSEIYVKAVSSWLKEFSDQLVGVDLGCGDFHIGYQLFDKFKKFVACDIVEALIERNKKKFEHPDLLFMQLDLTKDELPDGDIVFVRQVFQHLSNELIEKSIRRIEKKYKYLVLSEHLPHQKDFRKNVDKPSGWLTRIAIGSAIDITEPPFNLSFQDMFEICSIPHGGGFITTTVFEF